MDFCPSVFLLPAHMIEIRVSIQLKTVFANSVQKLVHPRSRSSFAPHRPIHTASNIPSSIWPHIIIRVDKLVDPITDSSMRSQ